GTSSAAVLRAEPWRAADCRSVCVCVLWAFVCVACCVRLCVVCPVSEALKHLSAVDSLSRSVAELRCSLNRLSNNGSAEDGCCSLGWIQFGSSCYFFSRVSLNWDESKVWCEKQNAHLVIIITDEEWALETRPARQLGGPGVGERRLRSPVRRRAAERPALPAEDALHLPETRLTTGSAHKPPQRRQADDQLHQRIRKTFHLSVNQQRFSGPRTGIEPVLVRFCFDVKGKSSSDSKRVKTVNKKKDVF
uniref:C-type lectin domain-containing protein n=1 Tax=Oryzias sinensis TaxID=183150 RepID=A0A8C7WXP4_9TELE